MSRASPKDSISTKASEISTPKKTKISEISKDKEKTKCKDRIEGENQEDAWITVEKNALVIIPGTYQGGFLARIVNFEI